MTAFNVSTLSRRSAIQGIAASAVACALPAFAAYPDKPITITYQDLVKRQLTEAWDEEATVCARDEQEQERETA